MRLSLSLEIPKAFVKIIPSKRKIRTHIEEIRMTGTNAMDFPMDCRGSV
jgi:hypothetical protein